MHKIALFEDFSPLVSQSSNKRPPIINVERAPLPKRLLFNTSTRRRKALLYQKVLRKEEGDGRKDKFKAAPRNLSLIFGEKYCMGIRTFNTENAHIFLYPSLK